MNIFLSEIRKLKLIIGILTLFSSNAALFGQISLLFSPEAGLNNSYLVGTNLSGWLKSGSVGFATSFSSSAEYNFESENLKVGAGVGFCYQPLYYVVTEGQYLAGRHKANFCFVRIPVYVAKNIRNRVFYTLGLNGKIVVSRFSDSLDFLLATPNDAKIKKFNYEAMLGLGYSFNQKFGLSLKSYFEMPGFLYERRPEKFIFSNFSVMLGINYKLLLK
jgi:hypothetical protein